MITVLYLCIYMHMHNNDHSQQGSTTGEHSEYVFVNFSTIHVSCADVCVCVCPLLEKMNERGETFLQVVVISGNLAIAKGSHQEGILLVCLSVCLWCMVS